MEDHVIKMNMFCSDISDNYTDGIQSGEPQIVVIRHYAVREIMTTIFVWVTIEKFNFRTNQ